MSGLNNSQVPIYIINLEKSTDRKAYMQAQFDSLFDHNSMQEIYFFTGINGKENPNHPLFKRYNNKKRLNVKGYPLTLSQLGCYASHYSMWEKCVELNQPIIILEDDAKFKNNFLDVLAFINSDKNTFEFFWLQPDRLKNKRKLVADFGDFSIQQFSKGFIGATGYYLTPKAAKKFLAQSKEWYLTVDVTMDRFFENKVPPYAIVPFCLEADYEIESTIFEKQKKVKSFKIIIARELFNIKTTFKRLIYNILN
ncbi:glycosyltransferase family 25 protein [Rodentibacter pneumotropicus]|uniref:glycosyltransferase family 25 protein n=1 Tax=Rodentibacter pneumotropicus TaxID=758 RepID=UPI00232B1838|nr:glycosyltransferase family 25 protein [Rodentibacter pneumotropicus]MDC2825750.1 glycosyltransferase family 25 protein [Rodentibacter pneumotropicus]